VKLVGAGGFWGAVGVGLGLGVAAVVVAAVVAAAEPEATEICVGAAVVAAAVAAAEPEATEICVGAAVVAAAPEGVGVLAEGEQAEATNARTATDKNPNRVLLIRSPSYSN
jgi:hypothetical protein